MSTLRDADYDKEQRRLRKAVEKWRHLMHLNDCTISLYYERSYSSEPAGIDAVTHMGRWKYLEFEIRFYLPSTIEHDDDELEAVVVHELTHCLLAPLSRNMVPSDCGASTTTGGGEMIDHSPYIDIVEDGLSATGKTKIWQIFNKHSGENIGCIRWHGAWRGYVYESPPSGDISYIYDAKCLRQISDFITAANADHKAGKS